MTALLACLPMGPAHAREVVVLLNSAAEMPMVRFEKQKPVEGMSKDLGDALAQAMGRTARFMALPRKRIAQALENGEADLSCSYVPEWLTGSFDWSKPFFPKTEVLVTDRSVKQPETLQDVAGRVIGTVLGNSQPELEEALGKKFVRDDALSMEASLRKLSVGRVKHAVIDKAFLDYHLKLGDPPLSVYPPMIIKNRLAQCAVSRKGSVTVADVDRAIDQVVKDGTLVKILQRYQ